MKVCSQDKSSCSARLTSQSITKFVFVNFNQRFSCPILLRKCKYFNYLKSETDLNETFIYKRLAMYTWKPTARQKLFFFLLNLSIVFWMHCSSVTFCPLGSLKKKVVAGNTLMVSKTKWLQIYCRIYNICEFWTCKFLMLSVSGGCYFGNKGHGKVLI